MLFLQRGCYMLYELTSSRLDSEDFQQNGLWVYWVTNKSRNWHHLLLQSTTIYLLLVWWMRTWWWSRTVKGKSEHEQEKKDEAKVGRFTHSHLYMGKLNAKRGCRAYDTPYNILCAHYFPLSSLNQCPISDHHLTISAWEEHHWIMQHSHARVACPLRHSRETNVLCVSEYCWAHEGSILLIPWPDPLQWHRSSSATRPAVCRIGLQSSA